MPVPTAPPPGVQRPAASVTPNRAAPSRRRRAARPAASGGAVNDLLPFLDFVEHHPVGSSVNGVVESYSSHGAYVTVGDVRGYVPLRLMGNPPPRSAREVMRVGDAVTLVVTSFAPARRSVELAVPGNGTRRGSRPPVPDLVELVEAVAEARPRSREQEGDGRRRRRPRSRQEGRGEEGAGQEEPAKKAGAGKKAAAKKALAKKEPAKKAAAKKAARRRRRLRR